MLTRLNGTLLVFRELFLVPSLRHYSGLKTMTRSWDLSEGLGHKGFLLSSLLNVPLSRITSLKRRFHWGERSINITENEGYSLLLISRNSKRFLMNYVSADGYLSACQELVHKYEWHLREGEKHISCKLFKRHAQCVFYHTPSL
jgi:hypothetical protein